MVGNAERPARGGSMVFGAVLVALGAILLAEQVLGWTMAEYTWPLVIVAFGAIIFAGSLTGTGNEGTAVLGSMIAMVGSILFVQQAFELWATWAYAWTLIAPTSIGLGQMCFGLLKGRSEKVREGMNGALVGLGMFLVFGAFFELGLGISGLNLGTYGWPILLIGLGVLVLFKELLPRRS